MQYVYTCNIFLFASIFASAHDHKDDGVRPAGTGQSLASSEELGGQGLTDALGAFLG